MDVAYPVAEAVAVIGDRIALVGSNQDVLSTKSTRTRVIDCQGTTLLPGFNDAHLHLPGLARRLTDLDCAPLKVRSIPELQAAIRNWAAGRTEGAWVRGHGYDDLQLSEGRHPTRWDLDAASPDQPVWLEHRSGHASVLNSVGLALAGIDAGTPDPAGGLIDREPSTGEPTGVIFEMRGILRERLGNTRDSAEFEQGMRSASQLLIRYGITSVQDAGADNGVARWCGFKDLQDSGVLSCRITMFAGVERLDEFAQAGLSFGSGNQWLRLGHAKIMVSLTSGALHPSPPALRELVLEAHRRGFPVALHCIEEEAIAVAAEVLASCRQPGLADRIEHCAEGTPELVEAVRRSGATVVTQPGFVYHNGASYREHVELRLLPHLYPAGSLRRAGVPLAFGSDAPVIDPNPWAGIYSAVTRRVEAGGTLDCDSGEMQAVNIHDALRMYTLAGAAAEGTLADKGSIRKGMLADMVLVDVEPLSAQPDAWLSAKATMTIISGKVTTIQ